MSSKKYILKVKPGILYLAKVGDGWHQTILLPSVVEWLTSRKIKYQAGWNFNLQKRNFSKFSYLIIFNRDIDALHFKLTWG